MASRKTDQFARLEEEYFRTRDRNESLQAQSERELVVEKVRNVQRKISLLPGDVDARAHRDFSSRVVSIAMGNKWEGGRSAQDKRSQKKGNGVADTLDCGKTRSATGAFQLIVEDHSPDKIMVAISSGSHAINYRPATGDPQLPVEEHDQIKMEGNTTKVFNKANIDSGEASDSDTDEQFLDWVREKRAELRERCLKIRGQTDLVIR